MARQDYREGFVERTHGVECGVCPRLRLWTQTRNSEKEITSLNPERGHPKSFPRKFGRMDRKDLTRRLQVVPCGHVLRPMDILFARVQGPAMHTLAEGHAAGPSIFLTRLWGTDLHPGGRAICRRRSATSQSPSRTEPTRKPRHSHGPPSGGVLGAWRKTKKCGQRHRPATRDPTSPRTCRNQSAADARPDKPLPPDRLVGQHVLPVESPRAWIQVTGDKRPGMRARFSTHPKENKNESRQTSGRGGA
jgi:hypothetical protein